MTDSQQADIKAITQYQLSPSNQYGSHVPSITLESHHLNTEMLTSINVAHSLIIAQLDVASMPGERRKRLVLLQSSAQRQHHRERGGDAIKMRD